MEVTLIAKEIIEVAPVEKAVFTLANVSATVAGAKGDKGDKGEQGTPGVGLEDTDDLPEGATNLYFTDARVNALIGGESTQIQFNNAGVLGGSENLTWDNSVFIINADVAIGGNTETGISTSAAATSTSFGDWTDLNTGTAFTIFANQNIGYFKDNTNTGKFGINTQTPTVALDVVGDINLSGAVTVSVPDGEESGLYYLDAGQKIAAYNQSTSLFSYSDGEYTYDGDLHYFGGSIIAAGILGGTTAATNIGLQSTNHATKGKIILGSASAYDEANDRLGLGTTSPTSKLHVVGGTLTDLVPGIYFSATMPTVTTGNLNAFEVIVTSAGSSSFTQRALGSSLLAGYTGSSFTAAMDYNNYVAGTGTNIIGSSNVGFYAGCIGTTTGTNSGGRGDARNGNINVGLVGRAITLKNSATNIGLLGYGLNTGTTPIQIGGYFGLHSSDPTFASAALMCDNGLTTSDIFVARDNGTAVWSIVDGGNTTWADAKNMAFNTTTGTKIGTATSQKIGFWNATPIVQPTTSVASATFTASAGTAVNDASTFDGYTIGKVVKALRNAGILA